MGYADLQATEERGENARLSSFVGAMALGDLVKSTLGPKVSNLPPLHDEVADP
jgi:chaperonin GroEL (HSP60 family)